MAYPDSFDREELHMEAAAAFDRDGLRVRSLFERREPYQPPTEPFPTRRQPETVHVLSSRPVSARVDYAGRTSGWSFAEAGSEHVLTGEGYRALRLLVERVRKKPPFHRGSRVGFSKRQSRPGAPRSITGKRRVPSALTCSTAVPKRLPSTSMSCR
jgi:hypothetical protein